MSRQCLICDSPAILTRQAAIGIALVIRLANSAVREAQNTNEKKRNLLWLLDAAAGIASAYPDALRTAERVAKFQLSRFDCLCLECGALFYTETEPTPSS